MKNTKMRYSIEPRDVYMCICRYVKGYGFLSSAKNMSKNLSNKYGQKLLHSTKKSTTVAIKEHQKEKFEKRQKQLVI